MLRLPRLLFLSAIVAVLFSACGAKTPAKPAPTTTPDPCSPENIVAEVKKVNDLQRAFDDATQLAAVTRISELPTVIPSMQDLRRQAQDQQVPACLVTLKTLQLQQMNAVINTFLAFLASANQNADMLTQGISLANGLHQQYNQELARLIGATYVPPSQPATATPGNTPVAAVNTPAGARVTNNGTTTVNLRAKPTLDAQTLGLLEVGQSIAATGKTADGQWIQVVAGAGNTAWVFATLVQLNGGETLPVVTPTP